MYPSLLLVVLFLLFVLFPVEPREFLPSGQRKAGIGDRKTHFEKTFLVGRFDRKHLVGIPRTVDVGIRNHAGKGVAANDLVGIGEQVFRVGLEIDPPCGFPTAGRNIRGTAAR